MSYYKLLKIVLFQIVLCICCYYCYRYYYNASLDNEIQMLGNAIFNTDGHKSEHETAKVTIYKNWAHSNLTTEDFKNLKLLGSGANGKVFQLGNNYVLKVLKKDSKIVEEQEKILKAFNANNKKTLSQHVSTPSGDSKKESKTKEIKLLHNALESSISCFLLNLNLDFFCKYYAVLETPKYTYIILERVSGLIFEDFLMKEKLFKKNKRHILKLFRNLLYIVGKLHENNIVHMDLKTDNFMTTGGGNDLLKLIDLGSGFYNSGDVNNIPIQNSFKMLYPRGSVRNFSKDYAETLLFNNDMLKKNVLRNDWEVCKKYDIWCCGCILYEMIFEKSLFPIFSGRNIWNYISSFFSKFRYTKKVYKDRLKFNLDDYTEIRKLCDKEDTVIFYTLLSSILTKNDSDRKNITELLQMIDAELKNTNKV